MKPIIPIIWSYVIVGAMGAAIGWAASEFTMVNLRPTEWVVPVKGGTQSLFQVHQAIAVFIGAAFTLFLAGLRTFQTHKQTGNAIEQTKISRNTMQIDRFQKALEMIDAEKPIQTRLAGLRIMHTLGKEDPEILAVQSSYCFMDYIREATKENSQAYFKARSAAKFVHEKTYINPIVTGTDIILALNFLSKLREIIICNPALEDEVSYNLDESSFENCHLENLDLSKMQFTRSWHNAIQIENTKFIASVIYFHGVGCLGPACDISSAHIQLGSEWEMRECYFDPAHPPRYLAVVRPDETVFEYPFNESENSPEVEIDTVESPIVLPPNFAGTIAEKEEYFRTALRVLRWPNQDEDLAVLMAGMPFHGNETHKFRADFRARKARSTSSS